MLPPLGLAAPTICGTPFDTNATSSDGFCWDATTFGGFNYPVNKHKDFVASENWWGERLQYIEKDGQDKLGKDNPGNHVIGKEELAYTTRQFSNKYELVSDLELNAGTTPAKLGGMFYYKLALFGKPYVTVENDARQLANIVISQDSSDKKTLKAGEVWELGKGYSLTVNQVDAEGNKVWFSLSKNGKELESAIVDADGTVENQTFTATADFGDGKDQLYFITYVDSVFAGAVDSFAVFKYTWLIDRGDTLIINNGDEYQGFEVKETSKDGIVLRNSDSITLNLDKDKKNYFTDAWYFQTSDEGKGSTSSNGYIIYPATDVVIEDKNATESADNNTFTGEDNVIDKVSGSNESGNISPDYRRASPSEIAFADSENNNNNDNNTHPEEKTVEESPVKLPGFGIIPGIIGITVCRALKKKSQSVIFR
ncbi:hypothetical protein FXV91_08165 [Methanosarcina sp. DH2]|nr:hypothetical protein [Methanosarcina sp. DH2]